jgi:sulfur dioxygenase
MIFRQLFERESSTYTYLIGCEETREAVLIDTVKSELDSYLKLVAELDLKLIYILDTHTHADHITAAGALRTLTGANTLLGEQANSFCVSKALHDGDEIKVGNIAINAVHTPGHTDDSYCFILSDQNQTYAFTGDTLLIRGTGRTDFQNGNAAQQYQSLTQKLLTLPDDTWIYPAHDYKGWTRSTIGEERMHNPRLQVENEAAYVDIMNNLKLPNPTLMDIAVPANKSCGNS